MVKKFDANLSEHSYTAPAIAFLQDAFDDLGQALQNIRNETKKRKSSEGKEMELVVGKPKRLVINRPLFHGFEPLMAAKLGDYLHVSRYT